MENLRKTICLNMIVKNESEIITCTLKLLIDKIKIDYYVICDTGSTDNTIELITEFFKSVKINGEIHINEWKNFGHNRSLALEFAKHKCDYTLVFDADDYITGNLNLDNLTSDSYMLKFGNSHHMYQRKILVKSNLNWKFVGVLHECIICETSASHEQLLGDYYVVSGRTSSRNKNPNKYIDDANILEKGFMDSLITNDGLHNRYAYYCANSYADAGLKEKAIEWYKKTLTLNGWFDEKYNSCLKLYELINSESRFYYLVKSYTFNPRRVEGILELIKHYTCEKNYDIAWNYYSFIQNYYEKEYTPSDGDLSSRLFAKTKEYSFFLPYYLIIVCERLKKYDTGIFMLNVILKRKSYESQWWVDNLFFNLQFYTLTPEINAKCIDYVTFIKTQGITESESWKNMNLEFLKKSKCKLLFYTGFSNKPWNISTNETGTNGGSERAVSYLAQKLSKDYTVYISGDLQNEVKNEIICLNRSSLYAILEKEYFDIIIVSRFVSFFTLYTKFNCRRLYLMGHDTSFINNLDGCPKTPNDIITNFIDKISGVVYLTNWHKNNTSVAHPELKHKYSVVINNGIELSLFPTKPIKQRNSFVYSSCSARGLVRLVELWGDIIAVLPDAVLKIASYEDFPKYPHDYKIKEIIEQFPESITHLGKLSQRELYELMATSEYWLYPCCFHETSCITAMEMLMNEVVCLYYPLAGLTDTLGEYGIQVTNGNEIDTLLNLSERQKRLLRENGKRYAKNCSWENRAIEWNKFFNNKINHLESISKLRVIPKNHTDFLKELPIQPEVVYDIGACVLHWTNEAKHIFPSSEIILFEAMDEVQFLYTNYKYNLGVITDTNFKEIDFYQNLEFPGGNSYYKEIGHPNSDKLFNTPVKKIGMTLNTIVKNKNFPLPDLVKIDVQGCELDIFKGGLETINHARYLIVELQSVEYNKGAPLANKTIEFLENNGWELITPLPFCDNGPDGDYCFKNRSKVIFYFPPTYNISLLEDYLKQFTYTKDISGYDDTYEIVFIESIFDEDVFKRFKYISFLNTEPLNLSQRLNYLTKIKNDYKINLYDYKINLYDYSKSNIKILNSVNLNSTFFKGSHEPITVKSEKVYDYGILCTSGLLTNDINNFEPPRRKKIVEHLLQENF